MVNIYYFICHLLLKWKGYPESQNEWIKAQRFTSIRQTSPMKYKRYKMKNAMDMSRVVHLVSNSLRHPVKTASNFKISYNVPLNLYKKCDALVGATFTKISTKYFAGKYTFKFIKKY